MRILYNNKLIKLILLLALFAACEEPVDLDREMADSLVVNCHFSPDEPFKVWVSKSLDPLSGEEEYPEYVNNAEVLIFQGDEFICQLPAFEQGEYPAQTYFSSTCIPAENSSYTLKVEVPSFEVISATDVIPVKTDIQSFMMSDLEKEMLSDTVALFNFTVTLVLEEAVALPAYYFLDLNYERVSYQIVAGDTTIERTGKFVPLLLEDQLGNPPYLEHYDEDIGGILFSRQETGVQTLTFRVSTPDAIFLTMDLFDQIYANLKTVSKDYYYYHVQLTRQIQQKDSVFAEPVILADNVKNGYGIFAGFQLTRDSLSVDNE